MEATTSTVSLKGIKSPKEVIGYNTLTKIEKKFFDIMFAKAGTLYVKGRAGEGKSAIMKSIAVKLGWNYIDLRLSQCDELSVGLFPALEERKADEKYRNFTFAVPKWAIEANERPTIINFEELNRSTQAVMNAVLGILNERAIGEFFTFNESVLMCSTGNMGEEDGTVVNEMDAALKNRLITFKHSLTLPDWIDGYANDNVAELIVTYLRNKTSEFYKLPVNKVHELDAFASPRSWSNLSKFAETMLGDQIDNPTALRNVVMEYGSMYLGTSAAAFANYLEEIGIISYRDVLDNYKKVKSQVKKLTRPQLTEMINEIERLDLNELKVKQVDNLGDFLTHLEDDNMASYFQKLYDKHFGDITDEGIDEALAGNPPNNFLRLVLRNNGTRKVLKEVILPKVSQGISGS